VSAKFRRMKWFQVSAVPLLVTVSVALVPAPESRPAHASKIVPPGGLNNEVVAEPPLSALLARAGLEASTTGTIGGYGPAVICRLDTSSAVFKPRWLSWVFVIEVVPPGTVNALSVVSGVSSAPSPM
jgi:hypothetical protein